MISKMSTTAMLVLNIIFTHCFCHSELKHFFVCVLVLRVAYLSEDVCWDSGSLIVIEICLNNVLYSPNTLWLISVDRGIELSSCYGLVEVPC